MEAQRWLPFIYLFSDSLSDDLRRANAALMIEIAWEVSSLDLSKAVITLQGTSCLTVPQPLVGILWRVDIDAFQEE